MIKIVMTSHGGMAQGMMQSVKMLMGEQDNLDFVTFGEEMGADELDELIGEKITDTSLDNQYLILCDIKGGTPFNVVSRYSFKNDNVAVIYGMNLPILVEAIVRSQSSEVSLQELTSYLEQQSGSTIGLSRL
ncbi:MULTISPECIES: PTS sugar transporter subunit IIA [Lacrimispora]|jgi:mannose/fructose/sorbose-specific phosphotransferase system IIA component|uniref:PTS sugar transporter subunit IIA n=1 Tax=Lacrimispora TaxID=2719231 RepID=UPI0008BB3546|nr:MULTISPECIES: PTS sugar transporter subunit IIA [Lacrimispora]MDR7813764.1 PTS sugar transporter subunit IIA [Lacrimispora sp.]SEU27150.1 PTS system, N-acetylgalactosamine-specific IIA component/PTS system, mannose-specific IIA component/PTS system, mannose-specific IIB component [Lacrimispora sphenoides]